MKSPAGPTRETARWREMDRRHHLHPFTNLKSFAAEGGRIITRAQGVWLWDSEGNRILDGMAGLWCVNVGYGRRELAQAARRQMEELPYYNTFFKTATPPSVELSRVLSELTPEGLDHVFYANSGSEANDTAIKLVRYYWNLMDKREKKTIIGRHYAYHGVTLATASLSGLTDMHPQFDLPLAGFSHIEAPYWYRHGGELSPEAFGVKAARALEERIQALGPEKVAAFFAEPINGAGGVIVPPETYFPEVQRICEEYDVLLIADEVVCGFGRTGRWFGCETFGIKPDLMTMAKGLSSGYQPISAVMVGDRVARALLAADQEFVHGFTYSGHPVACAVALANLEILKREGIIDKVRDETAPYLQARLRELADHPMVGEVRGTGMLAAVELVQDKAARKPFEPEGEVGRICRDHCIENDLVMRATRDSMLCSPPLVITKEEIDELLVRFTRALDTTARERGL